MQIPSSKPYINSYTCRLTETSFGAEITTIEKWGALQFQFNYGIYPIVQLSSLKLSIDSQCIQATSSKSISLPSVRGNLYIYTGRQSATLTKMSKWCSVWQYEYGCLPYILKFKFFFNNTCSTMIAWIHIALLQTKSEMIYHPKQFLLIIIHSNTKQVLDISCCHKHQQQKKS